MQTPSQAQPARLPGECPMAPRKWDREPGKQEAGKGSSLGEDSYSREGADPGRGEDLHTFVIPHSGIVSSLRRSLKL